MGDSEELYLGFSLSHFTAWAPYHLSQGHAVSWSFDAVASTSQKLTSAGGSAHCSVTSAARQPGGSAAAAAGDVDDEGDSTSEWPEDTDDEPPPPIEFCTSEGGGRYRVPRFYALEHIAPAPHCVTELGEGAPLHPRCVFAGELLSHTKQVGHRISTKSGTAARTRQSSQCCRYQCAHL